MGALVVVRGVVGGTERGKLVVVDVFAVGAAIDAGGFVVEQVVVGQNSSAFFAALAGLVEEIVNEGEDAEDDDGERAEEAGVVFEGGERPGFEGEDGGGDDEADGEGEAEGFDEEVEGGKDGEGGADEFEPEWEG